MVLNVFQGFSKVEGVKKTSLSGRMKSIEKQLHSGETRYRKLLWWPLRLPHLGHQTTQGHRLHAGEAALLWKGQEFWPQP